MMTTSLPPRFALLAASVFLLPASARAELPGPQLVELGKALGWTEPQTVQVDNILKAYSKDLNESLFRQVVLPDAKPRILLEDLRQAHAKYVKSLEQALGSDGFKAYLAQEQKALVYMHLKGAVKQLGSLRVPLELHMDQLRALAPILTKSRYASWAVMLEAAESPSISPNGLAALANRLDQIQWATDRAASDVLTPPQMAQFKQKRTDGEEMAAALREKKKQGYEGELGKIDGLFSEGRPLGRWKEGQMFDGVLPTPGLKSAANWYPGQEPVRPDEIRVTFMGTAPRMPRPGQFGSSVYVELGNGDSFLFDFGPAALTNYSASGVPLNQVNNIFLTNLEWSNVGSIPYMYVFGAWGGRWHETFRITGPSGRTPKHGVKYLVQQMDEMLTWHKTSFNIGPVGKGFDLEVNEFDFRDDGGVVYDKRGVKITHWRQSHLADGASAYRLDWNGLCVVYTGEGRPNTLTAKYAKGCDLLITSIQPELVPVASIADGTLPILGRAGLDMGGNPAYAAGYLYAQVKPRLAIGTDVDFDTYSFAEIVAEVREHWKGPFHLGAPDMVVVNMDKDSVWVRDGVVPLFPNTKPPKFDNTVADGMVIPPPRLLRADILEQSIRDAEIPPSTYYPPAYRPDVFDTWPTDKPIYAPWFMLDEKMLKVPLEKSP